MYPYRNFQRFLPCAWRGKWNNKYLCR